MSIASRTVSVQSTKHHPTRFGEEPESVYGHRGTLLDDMKLVKYVPLGQRHKLEAESHIVLGDDKVGYDALSRDFPAHPPHSGEDPATRRARAADMRARHFVLGDEPFAQRSCDYPEHPPSAHAPRAPRPDATSSLFVDPDDRVRWSGEVVTEYRRKYLQPAAPSADPARAIARDMGAHHFDMGDGGTDQWTRKATEFVPATQRNPIIRAATAAPSSVLVSAPGEWATTQRTDFARRAALPPPPLARDAAAASGVVLGTDPRELKTTHRGSYKRPQYVPIDGYTPAELVAVGLAHAVAPARLPPVRDSAVYQQALRDAAAGASVLGSSRSGPSRF